MLWVQGQLVAGFKYAAHGAETKEVLTLKKLTLNPETKDIAHTYTHLYCLVMAYHSRLQFA